MVLLKNIETTTVKRGWEFCLGGRYLRNEGTEQVWGFEVNVGVSIDYIYLAIPRTISRVGICLVMVLSLIHI